LRSQCIGALTLFNLQPGTLAEADLRAARALSDVATIGILSSAGSSPPRTWPLISRSRWTPAC
jgi:hypothetical protein